MTQNYKIFYEEKPLLTMIISEETEDHPRQIYFKEYKQLFTKEEWNTINLFEGELIHLINQLDEIDRKTPLEKYEAFREQLTNIWSTYKLEREALRLKVDQEKDFKNKIIIKRLQ